MKFFDNVTNIVRDDMTETITRGSRVSIAAACFSMYAYNELKKRLEGVDELRFIFTSPTFVTEKEAKQKREFYIPKHNREQSLYGTEFEIKLRNEMTQKAIAKECADWIRRKATFKSNTTGENMGGFMTVEGQDDDYTYMPISGFTTVDIGCERGNNAYNIVNRLENPVTKEYLKTFEAIWSDKDKLQDVTETVIENIATAYNENSPELIYFITLFNVFSEFLEDISEDVLPNEATGFKNSKIWGMLYDFQRDAVLAIINKLEKFNGCILADSVGLGKTFTDRLNWGNYDLVVIDESHNFRNGGEISGDDKKENRYLKLMNKVIRAGVKTKVLMLSATPVNNRFYDLRNQLAIAYEGNSGDIDEKLNTTKSIDEIFRQAQKSFNAWSKLDVGERTTDNLLRTLDFDFFEVLDSVTIARSRKHIEKYYNTKQVGKFPERLKPISKRPKLTDLTGAINYNEIYEELMMLGLEIYTPSAYIFPSKMAKYQALLKDKGTSLTQRGREEGIRRLMSVNLLKRLESSVYSFNLTLSRIKDLIDKTIAAIDKFEKYGVADLDMYEASADTDWDVDDQNTDFFSVGKKVKIDLADMDYVSWREDLCKDAEILELVTMMVSDIAPEHDTKLQTLLQLLSEKIENPINEGNKKVLVFSAFSDTADYLFENVSTFVKKKYGLDTALITGSVEGKSTIKGLKGTLNNILTRFSPVSKGRDILMPGSK